MESEERTAETRIGAKCAAHGTLRIMRLFHFGTAAAVAAVLGLVGCAKKQEMQNIAGFVDRYYDDVFTWSPSGGTATGFHQY
ncbi:MAG: hypothetical protein ABSC08_08635, partial [Bryobacteraceae bacterium]